MAAVERCGRTALALLLAVSLTGIAPASAGPGDEPPPPPGGAQPVVTGPGHAAGTVAISSGGGSATGGARPVVEERLTLGDTRDTFDIAGSRMDMHGLLATIDAHPILLEFLKRDLDRDIAIARLPLAIDTQTRTQLRKLDDKYVPLQAALSVVGEHGRAPIAVYETPNGAAMALKDIFDDPSSEPLRYGFITRVSPVNTHWVAGDLYVDKAAGVVSLVTWDSVATFSLDLVTGAMGQVLRRAPAAESIAFVASHNRTNLQSLATGCSQCSLSFLDEMRERDLHSGQIGELRNAVANGAGDLPPTHELSASRAVDFLRIRVDQTAGLPDPVIALTNSRSALVATLATRVEALLFDRASNAIGDGDFTARINAVREILVSVQGDRVRRILDRDDSSAVGTSGGASSAEVKLFNLRIDRLRVRDLEAIRAQLNDEPFAFLGASRDLDRNVVLKGVAAGRRQRQRIEQAEPRLPTADASGGAGAASTVDHEPARVLSSAKARAKLDSEALLERAEHVDAPDAPPAGAAAAEAEVDVDASHEAALSFKDQAKRMVEAMFAEVEREARREEERDLDENRRDDNDEIRREERSAL